MTLLDILRQASKGAFAALLVLAALPLFLLGGALLGLVCGAILGTLATIGLAEQLRVL